MSLRRDPPDTAYPACFVALLPARPRRLELNVPVAATAGLSWLPPSYLHLTLCYLGWLDGDGCRAVDRELRRLGPGCPGTFSLTGTCRVVGAEPTRSLVAEVRAEPALVAFRERLASELRGLGLRPAEPFAPHVTLARVGPGDDGPLADGRVTPLTVAARPPRLLEGRTGFRSPRAASGRLSPGRWRER